MAFAAVFFLNCSGNFEIVETEEGVYRINKITGKVEKIEGYCLITLTPKSSSAASAIEQLKEKAKEGDVEAQNYLKSKGISWGKSINPLRIGDIVDGYRFLGGHPADSSNWQAIKEILDTMEWKPGEKKKIGQYEAYMETPWDSTTPDDIYRRDEKTGKLIKRSPNDPLGIRNK